MIIGGFVIMRADGRPFYGLGGGIQMRTDAAAAARAARTLSTVTGNTGALHVRSAELRLIESSEKTRKEDDHGRSGGTQPAP